MARKKIETAVLEGETLPRDISWMYFNRRILQEAMREEVPVLERLSFLGIYSNNLDEFFRVRVGTLMMQMNSISAPHSATYPQIKVCEGQIRP